MSELLLPFLRTKVSLIIAATILLVSGCASTGSAKKADETNPFASYPVAEILDAGNKALDAGETERAVYIYMQALEIEQSAETWYRIGVGKARLGDKGYAWQAFKKAIELDPNHVGAQEELGLTYMAMAQPGEAELHLKKATELDPMRWRAWNALGVLADMNKDYAVAVDYYHAGLIAAPQSPMLMTNIGYSYYLAGNLQEAGSWLGRALIAEENYPPAVKNLALLYARQGWYDQAVKTFSRVISKPQAYNDVGYLAMRQGDYGQAYELLTEAIRLSPTYYEKAYENLELVKKQLEGTGTPANAALRSSSAQIVVAEGQDPRRASVTAELLNVRSSPDADADIVTHLNAGDKVDVIMTMPEWAFVNYRPDAADANLTGWVNSRYVGAQETQSTLVAETTTAAEAETEAEAEVETVAQSAPVAAAETEIAAEPVIAQKEQAPSTSVPQVQDVAVIVTSVPEPAMIADVVALPPVANVSAIANDEDAAKPGSEASLLNSLEITGATVPIAEPVAPVTTNVDAAEAAAAVVDTGVIDEAETATAAPDTAKVDAAEPAATVDQTIADTTAIDEVETAAVVFDSAVVSTALPAEVIQPLPNSMAVSNANASETVFSMAGSQPSIEYPNMDLAATITRKVEAVCEPGTQTEKTPQGAGSCIGVASRSADE